LKRHESWSARSRRIARERKQQARRYGTTGGLWHRQSRNAVKAQERKVKKVQGKDPQLAVRARRGNRAKAGKRKSLWKRLTDW
jgi:hypothetical protein